ncbi:MAG: response regulator [Sedimentisphaerales bacterium]|jgi:DNA-binding response OmpR family regulator
MQTQGRILAVDDDPNNIAIFKELLEDDYDLKTSLSFEQAFQIAREFRPDVILLDVMMPGVDGYEACRRLRERHALRDSRIIIVSAKAMTSEQIEGYRAGADDYVTKPFDGDAFLEKVRLHLRSDGTICTDQANGLAAPTTAEA